VPGTIGTFIYDAKIPPSELQVVLVVVREQGKMGLSCGWSEPFNRLCHQSISVIRE